MEKHEQYMRKAIDLSEQSVKLGGGPFGAVVVWHEQIVGTGMNQVVLRNDPTAHAEINAIKEASQRIKNFNLSDCVLYTSCEPCPMCLGAVYWSRIEKVFFGTTREDAQRIEFDDEKIYQEMKKDISDREISFTQYLEEEALLVFHDWEKDQEKRMY